MARRVLLVLAVAVAWAGHSVSPASAEGGLGSDARLWGTVTNLTPYTWQFITQRGQRLWGASFPATVKPGQSVDYELSPFHKDDFLGATDWRYDGRFTYQVGVVGGPPEFVTVAISGCHCTGIIGDLPPNSHGLGVQVIDTQSVPWDWDTWDYHSWLDGPNVPRTANRQLGWSTSDPVGTDVLVRLGGKGNWSVDAATAPPALVDLLNELCANAPDTTCSFKPSGPLTWGIGKAVKKAQAENCTVPGEDKRGGERDPEPDWFEREYEVARTGTLTVGGGISGTTEANLLGVIATELSIKLDAEHEWEDTKTFTKTTRVYIPPNYIAGIWVAPVEAKVKGTLTVSAGDARYTITNFGATRSGVSRDDDTPAFNVITTARPMTADEYQEECGKKSSGDTKQPPKRKAAPPKRSPAPQPIRPTPASLYPGRGVARVRLGDTQARVEGTLGQPLYTTPSANDCRVLDPRCAATPGLRGTWVYRSVSVVFGAGGRVSALIYDGRRKSARGVGVGTRFAAFRAAYRQAACGRYVAQTDCRMTGRYRGRTVKTVFHFIHDRGGRRVCDAVMVYFVARLRRGPA